MNETSIVNEIYVRPCVNGNSSTGEYFNFSLSMSKCYSENCTALKSQPGASMISPILLGFTGISGQIVALIYLHMGSRPSNHRTTFYVMLATLIWTDLIGKIITTPPPVISYIYGHWVGGKSLCRVHGYSMAVIGMVTHLLVAAMALERYLGIRCGYFYNRTVTTSRTRGILISLWVFGLIFAALPHFGIGEFKLHYPGTWCHINQHICADQSWSKRIFSNLYSAINLLCLLTVVICNLVVVGTLLKMRVTKFKPSKACRQLSTGKKPREREIQMVILLVIITVTFIISWTSLDVLMIANQIWPPLPNTNPILDIKSVRLVSLNQIIDPWSYIICRLIFRSKLWKSCRNIIIGKVGSRRFHSRTEGSSGIYSFAPKIRLSSFGKGHKRHSLPNPADLRQSENIQQVHPRLDKTQPSLDHSFNSESENDCKVDLQSCFSTRYQQDTKNKSFVSTIAKLLHFPSSALRGGKEDVYIPVQKNPQMPSSDDITNLTRFERSTQLQIDDSLFSKHEYSATYHGKPTGVNFPFGQGTKDSNKLEVMDKKGLGSSLMTLRERSNSWCCPNEFTLSHKLKSRSSQNLKKRD